MTPNKKKEIDFLVVTGPTATGKTKVAVDIASKYSGEIISADSRQIYKGMDIGTGKDLSEYKIKNIEIPYHLIDILEPKNDYSVYQFKNDFFKCYNTLLGKDKNIILCGGTGLYIESVLLDYNIPNVGPDINLRDRLEGKTVDDLIKELKLIDEKSYDKKFHTTKRRIIRTIEILNNEQSNSNSSNEDQKLKDFRVIGLKVDRKILLAKIQKRLYERLDEGMISEVESLLDSGLSHERLQYFGLEYKIIGEYLLNNLEFNEMRDKLNYAINRFSKRQMTFFRRMEKRGININWINPEDINKEEELLRLFK